MKTPPSFLSPIKYAPGTMVKQLIRSLADFCLERLLRAGHGLPKVLLGPVMPYPSTPCGWLPLGPRMACWLAKGQEAYSHLLFP
jgi:hypothetical protein